MTAIITPPKQTLKQKAKVSSRSKAGVSREDAVAAGNAVLSTRFDEARIELARLVTILVRSEDALAPVTSEQHVLMKTAREVADTAGTFGYHAMTAVGRSLEGYLLKILGTGIPPAAKVVALHADALSTLLKHDVRGALGRGESDLVSGLQKVVRKSLDRAAVPH